MPDIIRMMLRRSLMLRLTFMLCERAQTVEEQLSKLFGSSLGYVSD